MTPEGHPFWMASVYNVRVYRSTDDRNSSYWERVIRRYGDADLRWGHSRRAASLMRLQHPWRVLEQVDASDDCER